MANKSIIFGLVLIGSMSVLGRSTVDKNFFWYPKDDGSGVVPALVESSAFRSESEVSANPENIHFYLFTANNQDTYDEIFNTTEGLEASHWDTTAPVVVFAHGFGSSWDGGSSAAIRDGYITKGYPTNINLVLVNWSKLAAAPFYDIAAANTELVGEKIAYLLDFLVSSKFTTLQQIHLAGHSLGAHAVGKAGLIYQLLNGGTKVPRITALDPALPLFGVAEDEGRIDPTDAEFVQVIHTAGGTLAQGELAFIEPRGTVDIYPNSGHNQPGCGGLEEIVGACSHGRSYEYFTESIHNDNFHSCKCDDNAWDADGDNFGSCDCAKGSVNMGEWIDRTVTGIYFLTTNSEAPFAKGSK